MISSCSLSHSPSPRGCKCPSLQPLMAQINLFENMDISDPYQSFQQFEHAQKLTGNLKRIRWLFRPIYINKKRVRCERHTRRASLRWLSFQETERIQHKHGESGEFYSVPGSQRAVSNHISSALIRISLTTPVVMSTALYSKTHPRCSKQLLKEQNWLSILPKANG